MFSREIQEFEKIRITEPSGNMPFSHAKISIACADVERSAQ